MRVSTKIVAGFATLLVIAFAALAYQMTIIHEMQSINSSLSSVNFEAATIIQQMDQRMLDLGADTSRYFVTWRPDLRKVWRNSPSFLDLGSNRAPRGTGRGSIAVGRFGVYCGLLASILGQAREFPPFQGLSTTTGS
jgi:hypothetical protein